MGINLLFISDAIIDKSKVESVNFSQYNKRKPKNPLGALRHPTMSRPAGKTLRGKPDHPRHRRWRLFPSMEGKTPTAWRFTPQTWRSRAIARETLLDLLRFRYKSAGFQARKGFSPHELPKGYCEGLTGWSDGVVD